MTGETIASKIVKDFTTITLEFKEKAKFTFIKSTFVVVVQKSTIQTSDS